MRNRKKLLQGGIAAVLVVLLGISIYYVWPGNQQNKIVAYFPTTTGIYKGDDVRVLGVKVGSIDSIQPMGTQVKMVMSVDKDVKVPADANAIIVAQSLVSSRFVQLTPTYNSGPALADGGTIPLSRTAVPVEWDEIKKELDKLSTALGPEGDDPGALNKFIGTAAENLDGNGQRIRDTLKQLSQTMKIMSDGRTDLFSTVRNLQAFVSALSASNEQIVQFGGHLASVSQVLANSNQQLEGSLKDLNVAVANVQRFVTDNREGLSKSVQHLADVTQVLADKKGQLEKILHAAPTSLVNFYNIYQPAQGTFTGAIALNNLANPVDMICGAMAGQDGKTVDQDVDLCRQQLGPVLNTIKMNYPPIGTNPLTGVTALPNQVVYTDPSLKNVPYIPDPQLPPNGTPASQANIQRVPASGLPGLLVPSGGTK
ncbi:MlaD family protein [Speluncibacter jeojiensis]|uniref:MCE family protein n=1 Tax=Speluncibacter jeojiensis TaxID=2710754 RepID=A0A9X4REE6_9ACTN|nr:MCE family protein [Corynebacteriales bacterium D3-21]